MCTYINEIFFLQSCMCSYPGNMEFNLTRNSVWLQLVLVLFACNWKFITGDPEFVNGTVVKKINGAINGFVYDKLLALEGKINDSSLACIAKITSEYKHCETCMKRCDIREPLKNFTEIVLSTTIHFPLVPSPVYPPILPYPLDKIVPPLMKETVGILGNMGKFADKAVKDLFNGVSDTAKRLGKILKTRIQLPRIAFRAPRIRLPRIKVHVPRIRLPRIAYRAPRVRLPRFSFRAPRFSRGWGKKRDVQKAAREMGCSCTMCDPFQEEDSVTEKIQRVCGSSYSSEIKKLQIERNDTNNIYQFTNNKNQFVTKIVQELGSLKNINNKYYLTNSIMTISTPNGSELSLKMTKGMPLGITPLSNTEITEIANLEGPNVFALLKKNS